MSASPDSPDWSEYDFRLTSFADVSTCEIEESDLKLLVASAPNCVAAYEYGAFFYTAAGCPLGEMIDLMDALEEFGFSKAFRKILLTASIKCIPYVRFDSDGYSLRPEVQKPPAPVIERTDLQRVLGHRRVGSANIPEI